MHADDLKDRIKSVNLYNIHTPLDHEALYMRREMSHYLNFLISNKNESTLCELESEHCEIEKVIDGLDLDVYSVDVTNKEVKNLMLGICVVRVIIPNFIPITFGYGQEPLGMKRLLKIPFKLGLVKGNTGLTKGYLPHFFA